MVSFDITANFKQNKQRFLFTVILNQTQPQLNFFSVLRWLDPVFKKLSYSLLNTLNFRTVKLNKSVLNCSCILTYFLSNYGNSDDQCSVAMATSAYEICLKTVYFTA